MRKAHHSSKAGHTNSCPIDTVSNYVEVKVVFHVPHILPERIRIGKIQTYIAT